MAICVSTICFRNGNEDQKQRYLPDLCAGRTVGSLCITEPDTGSDAVGMKTTARRDGNHYVLNGSKTWITNAPIADVFIVYAKTNPEAGARGISAFIVERGTPGLSTSQTFHKMGNRGSPTGQVFFENCRIPAENPDRHRKPWHCHRHGRIGYRKNRLFFIGIGTSSTGHGFGHSVRT